jgi:DNA-binding transcriptional MerR regulator
MFRPSDLARAGGISPQTVRNYERFGVLPPAERTPSGQRRYGPRHMHAIRTARVMISGYSWRYAQRILGALHRGDVASALAEVDARHAELARRRAAIDEVLTALREVAQSGAEEVTPPDRHGRFPSLTIGAAARLAGVRASAVRFWEAQGLLSPERDQESRYRRYGMRELRQLRIIVLLRQGGYGFEAIRSVLAELSDDPPERALVAIEARRVELLSASQRCMAGTAAVWDYLQQWPVEMSDVAEVPEVAGT